MITLVPLSDADALAEIEQLDKEQLRIDAAREILLLRRGWTSRINDRLLIELWLPPASHNLPLWFTLSQAIAMESLHLSPL